MLLQDVFWVGSSLTPSLHLPLTEKLISLHFLSRVSWLSLHQVQAQPARCDLTPLPAVKSLLPFYSLMHNAMCWRTILWSTPRWHKDAKSSQDWLCSWPQQKPSSASLLNRDIQHTQDLIWDMLRFLMQPCLCWFTCFTCLFFAQLYQEGICTSVC